MHSTQPRTFRHASFHGRIGIARADITPPVGIYARNWGAAKHDEARAIHRPLTLTAMTLAPLDGGQNLILLDTDLGWWKSPQTFRDFQTRLLQAVSVEPASLIFALSHTHSAPPLMDADDSLPGSGLHRAWMKELFESTVHSIRQALDSPFVGTIDWHAGRCGLATNRDLPDPDSRKPRVVCGYNPSSDVDDALLVGRITDVAGRIRATLVNYACHPTTLAWENKAISPDYVGAMREVLQRATEAPTIFLLGACGELAPRLQYVGDPEVADRHGRELGFAALATLHGMEPPGVQLGFAEVIESGAPLAVWKHEPSEPSLQLRAMQTSAELPLKNWPSAEELEKQRLDCTDRAYEERLRRKRNVRLAVGDGATYDLKVYVWRIGDAVLVGSCCEAYSILQQELRRRFPNTILLCMNLINGSVGYLPPAELYNADVYAVWQTPFDRGSLERTLETMTQAIRDVLIDENQLYGVLPVLQTPFTQERQIDRAALQREIDWAFETGADGVVVAMVSEILRLSSSDRRELAALVCEAVAGRGFSVISVGAESSVEAIEFAEHAESLGASAVMAIPPVAAALGAAATGQYFASIASSVSLPLVVQDASSYVGAPVDLSVYLNLLERFGEDRIFFKPEASPLGPNLSRLRDATHGAARIFEGSGGINLVDCYRRGIVGTMPGMDLLDAIVALWNALEAGDEERIYRLSLPIGALVALQLQAGLDGFLAIEKHLLMRRGLFDNTIQAPPVSWEMDSETRAEVDRLFAQLQTVVRAIHHSKMVNNESLDWLVPARGSSLSWADGIIG